MLNARMIRPEEIDLVVSCPNDGGLVRIQNGTPIIIDSESTTGICFYEGKLFRCLQNTKDTPLNMIIYGKERTTRLVFPDIRDVHDIYGHDGRLTIVSTGANEVVDVSTDNFEIVSRTGMKGKGDAWHLNCLELHDRKMMVSAFGTFMRHRGYKNRTKGAGILFYLDTGKVVLNGFSQPHSPKIIDGRLFICNSGEKAVRRIDLETGSATVLEFENYTRGIAYSERYIFIGVSSSRNIPQDSGTSKIVVLDRYSLKRLHEIPLDCGEIYNICSVPDSKELPPLLTHQVIKES